jgi:integrase
MAEQSRQTGSILERPRGSRKFYIKFLEPAGPNGKKRQRMVRVQGGRADAARELRARLKAIDDNTYVAPSRITLAEALQRWLKNYAVPNVAAKTRERYQEIVEKHLIPALGERRLTSLTPFEIQAYYTQALERGRRRAVRANGQAPPSPLEPSARPMRGVAAVDAEPL